VVSTKSRPGSPKRRPKAQLKPLKEQLTLQERLYLIRDLIGEAVVFQLGFRKTGEVDLLSIETFPSLPSNDRKKRAPPPPYIG